MNAVQVTLMTEDIIENRSFELVGWNILSERTKQRYKNNRAIIEKLLNWKDRTVRFLYDFGDGRHQMCQFSDFKLVVVKNVDFASGIMIHGTVSHNGNTSELNVDWILEIEEGTNSGEVSDK